MYVCVQKLSSCFLCGTPGHLSSQCPSKHCNNCGLPGHLYDSCSERAYWHKQCHRCSMTGHFFDVSIAFCFIRLELKFTVGEPHPGVGWGCGPCSVQTSQVSQHQTQKHIFCTVCAQGYCHVETGKDLPKMHPQTEKQMIV